MKNFKYGYENYETKGNGRAAGSGVTTPVLDDLAYSEKNARKVKDQGEITSQVLNRVIDNLNGVSINDLGSQYKRTVIEKEIHESLVQVLEKEKKHLSYLDKQKIIKSVSDEIIGYGPITSLINDPTVTEVMVNSWDDVYVEREGKIVKTDVVFRNDNHVLHVIDKIITPLQRRLDEGSPMVDARLPDGSRVNAIIPPLAIRGPTLTIRKFAVEPYVLEDLISFGTITQEIAWFIKACVRARCNILVSGGTGSGKTTTLNVLSSFIPNNERIVTIEDAAELQLKQEHVIPLESRPVNSEGKGEVNIRELVINSLRMRPDRIVVGEVRGGEALDMLQAMNTGHDGSISTLHANSPRDALSRLETMVMMAGIDIPLRAIREHISSAIQLVVQQSRFPDGTRKITKVSEVVGMEGDMITLQDLFVFEQEGFNIKGDIGGKHVATGVVPSFIDKFAMYGEKVSRNMFEGKSNNSYVRGA